MATTAWLRSVVAVGVLTCGAVLLTAQGRGGAQSGTAFPGGRMNEDGSLMPAGPSSTLFSQEAYTQYEILEPGSEAFAITYLLESARAGATEITNATRAGSMGTNISVFDPRTGQPVKFTYDLGANGQYAIRATLPFAVPEGGIGRVLIYKTYTDARTYQVSGDTITWVRSLSGYRLGVVLPKGYAFVSSNVAAQMSTLPDGRLKLAFANPSGQANNLTIHAKKTPAAFTPSPYTDMFFDDIKTLYDLGAPETGTFSVEQTYSDPRKGATATIDILNYLPLSNLKVVDLDTAATLTPVKAGAATRVTLGVPITNDKQSAHLRVTGTGSDGYRLVNGELVFDRELHGLRNTVVLPAGWEISGVSQSGTVGRTREGRVFVALVNLNAENQYRVTIRARK
ncbi:MAG: hypothetical protein FJW21_07490 [Acidimicrobiia bacterium]|nr:hypothetical protein [Acidimicrobiia bacterium]